jgi:hypothetical protein
MKFKIYILIISGFVITCFNACHKYPENTLWFKKPEKAFKGGLLTSYKVNGIDSLPMWDSIFNTPPNYNGWGHPYDIRKAYFGYDYTERRGEVNSSIGHGNFAFINKKKDLSIYFDMRAVSIYPEPEYNLFLTKTGTWQILKLTKGGSLKIRRKYNNKTYEIQIN